MWKKEGNQRIQPVIWTLFEIMHIFIQNRYIPLTILFLEYFRLFNYFFLELNLEHIFWINWDFQVEISKKIEVSFGWSMTILRFITTLSLYCRKWTKKMFEYKCRWWIQRGKLFCVFKIKRRHKWNFKRIWNSIRIFVCANVWLNSHMRKNHRIP